MTRATSGANHRILVIDDHPNVRHGLVELLRSLGQVSAACGGEEALALARHFRPHAIVVDWHMPVMDGPEFVRRYRRTRGRAAIVLMSADPSVIDMAAELQVTVPQKSDPSLLSDCVSRVLHSQSTGMPASGDQSTCDQPGGGSDDQRSAKPKPAAI